MDLWQCKRQFAWLLGQAAWEDAPQDAILTESFVSEDLEGNFLPGDFLQDGPAHKALPFARVIRSPLDEVKRAALQDSESIYRVTQAALRAYVVAGGSGIAGATGTTSTTEYDTHGENQVTGALRSATQGSGKSVGRDVDEIVDRLVETLGGGQLIDSVHAIQGEVFADLEAEAVDGVQVLTRPIDIFIYNATRQRYYHPVAYAAGSKVTTTNVLTWTAAPARFDTWGVVVRRGATAGSPAPSSPSAGVSIPVVGNTATDPAPAVGVNNYAIFVGYTETPAAVTANTPDRYSDRVTVAVTF